MKTEKVTGKKPRGGEQGGAAELSRLVMAAAQAVHRVTGAGAAQERSGITVRQVQALSVLVERGEMTVGGMGLALGIAASTASELADRLVAGGYAERYEKGRDRRRRMIRSTRRGRAEITRFERNAQRGMEKWLAGVSPEDRAALVEAFRTILRVMEGTER